MANLMKWLEEKNTRLRPLAGAAMLLVWVIIVLVLLAAWYFGIDLNKNGVLPLFYSVSTALSGILGIHMATKPGA
ncbi:hypothetical protein [Poseidonibacter lekithochrous]|uniref:hypothetical protein n=1 Tax=Poseidonibacter lekithochrous TaxID=1904463 RepID=UPI000D38B47D|nr:hypothetical protein [Poseidonibacter lekithochrous]